MAPAEKETLDGELSLQEGEGGTKSFSVWLSG